MPVTPTLTSLKNFLNTLTGESCNDESLTQIITLVDAANVATPGKVNITNMKTFLTKCTGHSLNEVSLEYIVAETDLAIAAPAAAADGASVADSDLGHTNSGLGHTKKNKKDK